MIRSILIALFILAFSTGAQAGGPSERDRVFSDLYFKSQLKPQAVSAGEDGHGAGITFVIMPEFHSSSHSDMKTKLGGTKLKTSDGDSKTGSLMFTVSKELTDTFSLGFLYQIAYMDYSGGLLTPDLAGFSGQTELDSLSHLVGFFSIVNLKEYGTLNLSLLQDFDSYDGHETFVSPYGTDTRTLSDFKTRVTSLMAWYERRCNLSEAWSVTPYLGWRSVYAVVSDQNNFGVAAGMPGDKVDAHAWAHLISGGLSFDYQNGPWGVHLRAGVNHRTSHDDVPGLASRAMAPGMVHIGYNIFMDRTLATYNLGLNYVFSPNAIMALGYDGAAGSDSTMHKASLALVFPF
ncbi:hypothetical protein C4J81_16145 [Deltaproteobacteria bacterium Smac51]|nr:hypothetical protein C4J81_16145 [Deltaproteobacteria bacterium Smac51]